MLAIFFICLYLGINVRAGIIATTSTATDLVDTTTASFDEEAELKKIAETCLSNSEVEELAGYIVRSDIARLLSITLIPQSVATIGLTELRSTLNLEPLPPWKPRRPKPSDNELASAPTIQAYYDLIEPKCIFRSLDSRHLYEHNVTTAVKYLDKRFPAIRKIFRRRFEEVHTYKKLINRKEIDRMIEEYKVVFERMRNAVDDISDKYRFGKRC
ncbi:unnamed protein product [Caenorhabditis nigoni]